MRTSVIQQQPEINASLSETRFLHNKKMDLSPIPIKRTKLWELDNTHHCPVIGLCLPSADLERFAKRFGFTASISNAHDLHVEAVCRVASRNPVAETIHKHLDRLYANQIKQFDAAKTDNEVLTLWDSQFTHGKIAGALWAALTHKRISSASRKQIHDQIHMHTHAAVAELATAQNRHHVIQQRLQEQTEQLEQLQEKHAQTELRLRQQLEQAATEIKQLQRFQRDNKALQQRLKKLESNQAMLKMSQCLMRLTTENEQLQIRLAQASELKQSLKNACHNLAELYRERDTLHAERDALENLLLALNSSEAIEQAAADAGDTTNNHDCILCVGGRSALVPHYRALARQLGLTLSHHDGGREDALSRLPEMIYGATAVICPTDCVSHAAYYQIKKICRLGDKPCLLFKGAGISSFARALTKIISGQTSENRSIYSIN
ncbi:hypothetical protein Nstercoris_00593 [Nitrosomonas stercoris]|uniref:DUF2325 domain-containing protein n=1 Tax=Nitrosomonas stercoris TaxID=1444684 RepID=A0A4Y1YJQ1_9PROT|nr:hypothetical protein Nstercoris_00593 [Nitrosomonas stercoris]